MLLVMGLLVIVSYNSNIERQHAPFKENGLLTEIGGGDDMGGGGGGGAYSDGGDDGPFWDEFDFWTYIRNYRAWEDDDLHE